MDRRMTSPEIMSRWPSVRRVDKRDDKEADDDDESNSGNDDNVDNDDDDERNCVGTEQILNRLDKDGDNNVDKDGTVL